MSINIQLSEKQLSSSQKCDLHMLPAAVNGDGQVNVDNFFNNYTSSANGVVSNALRGYPILGVKKDVPNGYNGVVLQESRKPLDETAERQLRVTGCFDNFTYWNYDKVPSKADAYTQALHYLDVADELAKPITEAEVLDEMKRNREEREA